MEQPIVAEIKDVNCATVLKVYCTDYILHKIP